MIGYSTLDFHQDRLACFSCALFGLEGKITLFFSMDSLFVCLFLNLFVGRKIVGGWGGQTGSGILLHLNASVPEG